MNPTESALLVTVPEAEPIVAAHRARLDSGAIRGVPSHVTVLYPFMAPELLTDDVMDELARLFAVTAPFDLTFESIGWFGTNVAYLRPTPDEPLRHLTATVVQRWPHWPPYGGEIDEPTPHLTIGDHGDTPALTAASTAIEPALPITTRVTHVHLFAGSHEPASWHPRRRFTLEARASHRSANAAQSAGSPTPPATSRSADMSSRQASQMPYEIGGSDACSSRRPS